MYQLTAITPLSPLVQQRPTSPNDDVALDTHRRTR